MLNRIKEDWLLWVAYLALAWLVSGSLCMVYDTDASSMFCYCIAPEGVKESSPHFIE